jgi:peptide/nickel transport system substrate-binding protein
MTYAWRRLAAALILVAAAEPARAADAPANTKATLVFYDASGNQSLDPAEPQSTSGLAQLPLIAIYDSLIGQDDASALVPRLATAWRYNADLTEFTLTLRQGVVFHDGAKFDAAAVAANLERAKALGSRAGTAIVDTVSRIKAVEVLAADTVRLRLTEPNGQMPYLLATQGGMMISPAALTGDAFGGTLKPVGAGPYRVRGFDAAVRTLTDRFDAYWGGVEGRPAGMEHHFVPEAAARLNALRSGQINLALIDPRQIPDAKAAGLQVQVNEKDSVWDIYPNTSRPPMNNLKVRQAFMHALDRAEIADALGFGAAKPTVQLYSEASPLYDKSLDALYPYDPVKARALLVEAGHKDGVEVNWLILNTSEYRLLSQAIQAMAAEAGIRLKFDVVDVSQYMLFRRPPGRGDIFMGRWGGRGDPLQTFQEVGGTGGSVNAGGAVVPEIDALLQEARLMDATDPMRTETLRKVARIMTEQVSHIPVMTRSNVYAYRPGCILNLGAYLPTGSDRINDTRIAAGCK